MEFLMSPKRHLGWASETVLNREGGWARCHVFLTGRWHESASDVWAAWSERPDVIFILLDTIMRSHKRGKTYTLLYSYGNECLISNKSSRLCYSVTFCSNKLSGICISSQLCIAQGYWNDVTHQSRQPRKQCFSPLLAPLFSQTHSCTAPTRGRESMQGSPGLLQGALLD